MRHISLTLLLTLIICLSVETNFAQRRADRPTPPIIDMHIHAFGFDEFGDPPPPNEITGKPPTARTDMEAMEAVLAAMKRYNIVKAVASGPLEDVLRWREAAPDRIIGGAYAGEEFHEYLKGLMRAGMGKRLMFGSDQMVWPEAIGLAIQGTESAKFLTPDQKRDIFYNNAARFLKLDNR